MNTEVSNLRSKGTSGIIDAKLILASLSLGGILLVSEAERLPTFSYTTYQHDPSLFTSLFLAVFFGALLIGKYFKPSAKRTPPLLIMLMALALSAILLGVLIPAGILAPWVCVLCDVAHSMLWPLFLYAWVREILPLGYSYTIKSFAFGLIVVGILNLLSMAMNTVVSIVVIALLPLLSGVLLIAIKAPDHSYAPEIALGRENKPVKKQRVQFLLFTIVPLACFAIVFGNIHLSWNTLQDGSGMSLIVQLGVATGTLLAGLGVYGLYAVGTLRKYNSIVMLILVAFTLFSIWLSTYTNGNLVFLYATFLNIAQKGVFLLIFLALFRGPWRDPLFSWCASMCAFLYGTFISSTIMSFNADMVLVTCAVIALCLLMVASVAMLINDIEGAKFSQNHSRYETESDSPQPDFATGNSLSEAASNSTHFTTEDATEFTSTEELRKSSETTGDSTPNADVAPATPHRAKDEEYVAYMRLVQEYALTRREADVLSLLIHGRTAEPIAKTLGISHATAKTHLRNIYTKLGVHTQQEVIDLMEEYLHQ